MDSVISTTTFFGSTSAAESFSITFSARRPDQSWRGERLNPTRTSRPCVSLLVLTGELIHDPIADRLDQPELLGDRDELAGWRSSRGIAPPDQRLQARDRAIREVDDRLPVQDPVLMLHRTAQSGGQRQTRDGVVAPAREHDRTARLRLLRLVHRRIRVLQQARRIGGVLREEAHAERGRREELDAAQVERLLERLVHPGGHGLGDEQSGFRAGHRADPSLEVGEQQEELVATLARDQVRFAGAPRRRSASCFRSSSPAWWPSGVVHELEVVEVEVEHSHAEVMAARARSRLPASPRTAPGSAGRSACRVRQEGDLLLGELALSDVEDHALDQPGLALLVVDRVRLLQDPAPLPSS